MTRSLSTVPSQGNMVLFSPTFIVVDAGSTAIRAIVSGADKVAVRKRAHAIAEALDTSEIPGITTVETTNDSVLVEFDPTLADAQALKRLVRLVDASIAGPDGGAGGLWGAS